jgi:hypothetical protein
MIERQDRFGETCRVTATYAKPGFAVAAVI